MKLSVIISSLGSVGFVFSRVLPLHRRQQTRLKPLIQTKNGVTFEVEIDVNNQTFYLIPDTGSSDLWVPIADFQCVDPESGDEITQDECHFGNTYRIPNSTEYLANQTFGVQYGTGIAVGKMAYADVTLNGVKIEHQQVGLVDRTNDIGDEIGSGVLGLGFPALTSAHYGTEVDNTTLLFNRAVYDPVFVAMYKKGLVESWYSFAIERPPKNATSGPGGWLGLGELPPVAHSDDWAVKPIEATNGLPQELTDELTGNGSQISLMTLTVEGVSWSQSLKKISGTNSTTFQAVVDTGNPLNLFPYEIAEAVNSAFVPPAVFDDETQVYVVECNATTPELGIVLDGHKFWHQRSEDLMFHDISGFCYSSVSRTGDGSGIVLNFLGDAFLRNVVSVFDLGKEEMRFAARV